MSSSSENKESGASNGEQQATTSASQTDKDESTPRDETALAKAKGLWAKTGITLPVLKIMIKGALGPTIVIAAYQSDAWANQYSTLGYLVGVMTQLSVVFAPRAKFLQTMLVQVLLTCLAAAIMLLAAFCAVHARLDTDGASEPGVTGTAARGAQTVTYNASASAVAGVWLFVEIYGISAFRAHFPQYTIPCVMFAIFANVSMTYAPQFSAMSQAETFCLSLLQAFLTGFAVASGVSLLILPVTSREIFFDDIKSFISSIRDCLGANTEYLNSLEGTDMFAAQKTNTVGEKPWKSPQAAEFAAKMNALSAVHTKTSTDLTFAKREVALGKLGPDDLQQIFKLLREITVPMVGLSSLSDIFERVSQESGWDRSRSFAAATLADAANDAEKMRIESMNEWHELIRMLKEPFASLTEVIDEALEHALLTLQLSKVERKPGAKKDQEATGDRPEPGDEGFSDYLDRRAEEFLHSKKTLLRGWCIVHDIHLPDDYFSNPRPPIIELPRWMNENSVPERVRLRRQLMILLYVEFMLYILAVRAGKLVKFADSLASSGKLKRTRLVVPGYKRLRKWFLETLHQQDVDEHDHYGDSFSVTLGQAYRKRKDPEHLPPRDAWEKCTNFFRVLTRFFGSSQSAFGFRVALATMSIAIINLLKDTQLFFTQERLFWAQIMTSIAMTPTAGASLRTFFLRIIGTAIATVLAIVAWYIVDENTAGILVFYYIFQLPGMWIMIKRPSIIPVGMISTVTLTLIIGYELQVRKVGIQVAESNGQIYHPIYELAPIRLVTVISGVFVGWVWTLFPYPITEHAELRQNTAKSLYLLANYYSTVNETISTRLRGGEEANEDTKGSPGQKLAKARLTIFSKCNMLLSNMRSQAGLIKYDIPCGGRFPKDQYEKIIERVQSILSFVSLVSVASTAFQMLQPTDDDDDPQYIWVRNLRKIIGTATLNSQAVTTLLSLLSGSLANGQPLPPYLNAPAPYGLTEKLDELDSELLSIRHIAEPGYASFAVIQIGVTCMIDDLKDLLREIKDLVGELDFSYHIISTSDSKGSEDTLSVTQSARKEQRRSKED